MGLKVIYVVGSSFSGSTVLAALLGQHPEVISAGELGNWTRRKKVQHIPCSCGLPWQDCPFWKDVQDRWLAEGHPGLQVYRHA